MDYLSDISCTESITDVQMEPEYQKLGMDLIWEIKDLFPINVEVKTDSYYHSSKNLFWEKMSNVERGIPGCFETSEADLFFYLFNPGNKLYIFPIKKSREWLSENEERFRTAFAKNFNGNKYLYKSQGYLIPRDVFVKECPEVIVIDTLSDDPQKIVDYLHELGDENFKN